jgi:hypothetical protein
LTEFFHLVQTFGLATGLLVVIGIATWRVLVWLKPWVEKAFAAHIDFVATTAHTVAKLGLVQERQEDTLVQIARTQEQQAVLLQQCVAQLEALRLSTERGNALLTEQSRLAKGGVAQLKKMSESRQPEGPAEGGES